MIPNKYRTVNHPHSKFVCNDDSTLGFVRISKCGSSSFTSRHNLNIWKNFEEAENIGILLSAIRDPYKRFISSIPETLTRIYCNEIPESKFPWTDVLVSKDIYNFLSKNNSSDPDDVLKTFIKAIQKFGYFDAHHEPISNFLLTQNKEIEINPQIFDLKDMDMVSNYLFSLSGQINKELIYTNVRSFGRKNLKTGLNKIKKINLKKIYHFSQDLRNFSNWKKSAIKLNLPICNHLIGYQKIIKLPRKGKISTFISENLKSVVSRNKSLIDSFIKDFYSLDLNLYQKVNSQRSNIKYSNLLNTLNKLETYI